MRQERENSPTSGAARLEPSREFTAKLVGVIRNAPDAETAIEEHQVPPNERGPLMAQRRE
jgi:hypothetical protein